MHSFFCDFIFTFLPFFNVAVYKNAINFFYCQGMFVLAGETEVKKNIFNNFLICLKLLFEYLQKKIWDSKNKDKKRKNTKNYGIQKKIWTKTKRKKWKKMQQKMGQKIWNSFLLNINIPLK